MNFYARQAVEFKNDMARSTAALLGIAQGLLADSLLNDGEIRFLQDWLEQNEVIATAWPGNVIRARVAAVLADGLITHDERAHLVETLRQLVGGTLEDLAQSTHVTELALDDVPTIDFSGRQFCLTGNFVFGPRKVCEQAITMRGGGLSSVNRKLHYLVVGGLGSIEWKNGSFGTKIESAVKHRDAGLPIRIVHEDVWAQLAERPSLYLSRSAVDGWSHKRWAVPRASAAFPLGASKMATKKPGGEQTSKAAGTAASKVLRSPKSSAAAKTAAGSALTQRPSKKK